MQYGLIHVGVYVGLGATISVGKTGLGYSALESKLLPIQMHQRAGWIGIRVCRYSCIPVSNLGM
jgi:hypothetical protein